MHSLKVQQNNSCRIAISFGWTVPQLFAGKSVTRRCWKDSYGQQFIKRWWRGITTYIALDKNWRQGGKQIGWITLTVAPYKERLCEMRYEDVAAEGFPELTRDEFIERFFNGDDQQQVWVVRFRFTPLSEESCSTRISSNLDIAIDTESVNSNPGGKSCSALGSRNSDIATNTENVNSNPSGQSCSTRISSNLDIATNTEKVFNGFSLSKSCSTRISSNLDIATDTESAYSLSESCSTRISSNLDIATDTESAYSFPVDISYLTFGGTNPTGTKLSLIGNEQPLWFVGTRVQHCKDLSQFGTVIKAVENSTRFFIAWDAGGKSAVEGKNVIRVEQKSQVETVKVPKTSSTKLGQDKNLPSVEQKSLPSVEQSSQVETVEVPKTRDTKPGQGKNLPSVEQSSQAETVKIPKTRDTKPGQDKNVIRVEQKSLPSIEQFSQAETVKVPKTRNTRPGRGNKPCQVKCNVTRNSSLGKSANTYWVYKFSFKVDGKYYNRSCSIPKEKVKRVIEMWESKQYSWRDIVEYIGKNPDKIVDKLRSK